jgi:hypothetical protein
MSALPSALPSPKVKTHLPAFAASVAGLLASLFVAGFLAAGCDAMGAAGVAGLLAKSLRALGGAAFARSGADGFDFAGIFLVFDAVLTMAYNVREREKVSALHHVSAASRKLRSRFSSEAVSAQVKPPKHPEADQADANQVDRDHQIE